MLEPFLLPEVFPLRSSVSRKFSIKSQVNPSISAFRTEKVFELENFINGITTSQQSSCQSSSLVLGNKEGYIELLSFANGFFSHFGTYEFDYGISSISWMKNSNVAVVGFDQTSPIQLVDFQHFEGTVKLQGSHGPVRSIEVTKNNQIISCDSKGVVNIYDYRVKRGSQLNLQFDPSFSSSVENMDIKDSKKQRMKRQSLDYKVVLINENIFMTLLSSKYKALLFDIRMIYSNPKKWKPLSILSSSTPHKYYVDGYFSSELENLVLTSNKSIETFSFDGSRFYQNLEFNFFTPENNLHPLLHLTERYMYVFNRNCGEIYVFSTHDLLKHPKIVQVHSGRVYPLPLPSNNCVKNPIFFAHEGGLKTKISSFYLSHLINTYQLGKSFRYVDPSTEKEPQMSIKRFKH